MNTRLNMKYDFLKSAMIDLTQSDDEASARRARAALFDAGVLHDSSDGGVREARKLYEDNPSHWEEFSDIYGINFEAEEQENNYLSADY